MANTTLFGGESPSTDRCKQLPGTWTAEAYNNF